MKTASNLLNRIAYPPIATTCIFILLIALIAIQFCLIKSLYNVISIQNKRIKSVENALQECFKIHETINGKYTWDDFKKEYTEEMEYQRR